MDSLHSLTAAAQYRLFTQSHSNHRLLLQSGLQYVSLSAGLHRLNGVHAVKETQDFM